MTTKKSTDEAQESQSQELRTVQEAWGEFRSSLKACLPDEFWEHERACRRELLLAGRSLIDAAIEHLEQKDAPQEKRTKKIEVE
ncbi:MAG: hypothetical protein MAG451_00988 [Anaerolineales bacterium]|nr:hypothetical protein [Anaerolineales bacterium]